MVKRWKPPEKIIYRGRMAELPEDDFGHLDVRVARVRDAELHPLNPNKFYLLGLSFEGPLTTMVVAGLMFQTPFEELLDRLVVVVCNVKPFWMRKVDSWCNIMVARTSDFPEKLDPLMPPPDAVPGDIITCAGYPRDPARPFINPDIPVFDNVATSSRIDEHGRLLYKGMPWVIEDKPGCVHSRIYKDCYVRLC